MRYLALTLLALSSFGASGIAMASNPLTAEQLLRSIQISSVDYVRGEPDMAKSISGLSVATIGNNAQVTITMKSDGMNMSAKYLCIVQGPDMACHQQQ